MSRNRIISFPEESGQGQVLIWVLTYLEPYLERVGLREEVTMTGGVARNTDVVMAIEKNLNIKLNVPQKPELTGAFGAAILGLRKLSREGRNAGGRN